MPSSQKRSRESPRESLAKAFAIRMGLRWLLILSLVVSCDTAGGEPAAAAGSDVCTAGTGACEGQDGESAARIRAFQDWLDANQMGEKDEYEGKQKELESICNPIMMKLYGAGGAEGGMPGGGMPAGAPSDEGGPGQTIDEVD